MTVERLMQKIKLGEKQLIQDSLIKLINMISENKKTQEDIIKHFSEGEIIKMIGHLEDPDPYLRKLAAKFLLDLVYGNYAVQSILCYALSIIPCDGKVCLNQVPDAFRTGNKPLAECLDKLKKSYPAETGENIPYCWYFTADNADQLDKQVEFIMSGDENKELSDIDQFIDPLNCMLGFIIKVPKVKKTIEKRIDEPSKSFHVKDYAFKKSITLNANSRGLTSNNNSLDKSLHTRFFNTSKSPERDIAKNISPVRSIQTPSASVSSRISYPRTSKAKIDGPISQSLCSTERVTQIKTATTTQRSGVLPLKSADRELNQIIVVSGYSIEKDATQTLNNTAESKEIKEKKSVVPDFSIDIFEQVHISKIAGSTDHSHDFGGKLLETSVCNTTAKGTLTTEKTADVSQYKVSARNEKKIDVLKKITDKQEKLNNIKAKPLDLDKKYTAKSFRDSNSYSFSATTTPKSTLLSKILKDKPAVKEPLYANKFRAKQDQKKLNVTTGASPIAEHKPALQKFSIAAQTVKGTSSKVVSEYINRKNAFHSSLLKSIDVSDSGYGMNNIEEKDENGKETIPTNDHERLQNIVLDQKHKTYHISKTFKSPISTPRSPAAEGFKSTLSQNSKILNARRSTDTSYFYSNKRKSDVSIPLQHAKGKQIEIKDSVMKASITEFSPEHTRPMSHKFPVK